MAMDRRAFLQLLTAGAASAAFPSSIARALEIPPHRRTGTIEDVEHVIFLMQENRSFDHYFGTMRGVRGCGDPRAVRLASGDPVWKQPHGNGYVLPFHPPAPESGEAGLGLTFLEDLAHDWTTTHAAWNEGRYDRWVPSKGPVTMAHLTRSDIPFHYALADAFTVCDAYYCSLMGPTDPNRYHMWTGWVGNNGEGGGPVVGNEESGYGWMTFPERLQKAGVSWKVYQDAGLVWMRQGSGARRRTRTSGTMATMRCCISINMRAPERDRRCTAERRRGRGSERAARTRRSTKLCLKFLRRM